MKKWPVVAALVMGLLASTSSVAAQGTPAAESKSPAGNLPLGKKGIAPGVLETFSLSKGVDSIIAEIRKREMDLTLAEQRIAERERAVVELEGMIEERSIQLDRIRLEIERRIQRWAGQGQDRVTQLANVYSSMPPAKAGALLGKLDLDIAVSIIRGMKKKSSAAALAAMRPARALEVSQRMLKPLDPRTDSPAAKAN